LLFGGATQEFQGSFVAVDICAGVPIEEKRGVDGSFEQEFESLFRFVHGLHTFLKFNYIIKRGS
jgi:hypothetical protein